MNELISAMMTNENLNIILDNLQIGIIVHTPDRTITFFNKESERITGYLREEVLGRDCHKAFKAPFCGDKCSFCDSAPQFNGTPKTYPLNLVTKKGYTRHVDMAVSPIMGEDNVFRGVIASFRDMTELFNLSLKAESMSSFAGIIGNDKTMQTIFKQIQDVALYSYPVHIHGDTGTGKERVACAIHDISSFGNGAFVPVNCGAIPEGIVESELFGHVKGAFSGAVKERKGRFELAHKGTLFLDEVAELPLQIQVKLLRFLEEGTFEKVGGEKRVSVETRIISATNKDLKKEVKAGRFREDLFYRLHVIPIFLPPLSKRKDDIPLLANHFLEEAKENSPDTTSPVLAKETIAVMLDYQWPGNVRELKNVIQFALVRCRGDKILPSHLPDEIVSARKNIIPDTLPTPEKPVSARGKLEPESVEEALARAGGNKSKAARLLGVGRATLYRFLARNREMQAYADRF